MIHMIQRILIIDDEESTRELLKLSLQVEGYKVYLAEDGYKGLAVFEEVRPEVVLTDIKMPGMDGIDVLRRLKQLNPDVEVIVITGHGEMELAIQALQLEASDFINKPISDKALSVALTRAREKIWMRAKLKDATEEIQRRHNFEHQLVQTSMDGIIANDPRGNIIIFNEGASRICGYTREEALCGLSVIQLYPPGVAQEVKKRIRSPEYGGTGRLINFDTQVLNKSGKLVPILLSATEIGEGDAVVATVGYFKDLTEIKKLQHELLEKTRMAALGQAMAEVAHGVKNILYGMKLGAYMLTKALARSDFDGVNKGWQMVQRNIDRISKFSLEMLSYARKDPGHTEMVSIDRIVQDVCESLAGQAESHGILLAWEQCCSQLCITGNKDELHTCILNLVTNALEAFPESAREGQVKVRISMAAEDNVCIEVSDTGKGMTPDVIDQIFRLFFTNKGARGTGLGLAISRRIIEDHGGSIHVRSEPRKGSTFTVLLPLRHARAPANESPESQ
jgi:two-component system NtrC family sensor kinase